MGVTADTEIRSLISVNDYAILITLAVARGAAA
jgi:hypothetical protein